MLPHILSGRDLWPCITGTCALLFALLLPMSVLAQDFSTTVSSQSITTDDAVLYEVQAQGDVTDITPPISPDFRIVGQRTGTSFRSFNGRMRRQVSATYTLVPRREGTLQTGAARIAATTGEMFDGEDFTIEVAPGRTRSQPPARRGIPKPDPPTAQAGGTSRTPQAPDPLSPEMHTQTPDKSNGRQPFVAVSISDRAPYVGEQVILDYVLFVPLSEVGFGVENVGEPIFEGWWYEDIRSQRTRRWSALGTRRIDGALYRAHMIASYILVPRRDGRLEIPAIHVEARARGFGRRGEVLAEPMELDVAPLPEEGRPIGFYDGNVGVFDLVVRADETELRAGETTRVRVDVAGFGRSATLALPEYESVDGLRFLGTTEEHDEGPGATGWIESTATQITPVQPVQEGDLTLPALTLHYFNPETQAYETATSDPLTLTVAGVDEDAMGAIPGAETGSDTSVEQWVSALPDERVPVGTHEGDARIRPFAGSMLYFIALVAGLSLLPLAAVARTFRRRRERRMPETTRRNAPARALREMRGINSTGRQFYTELRDVLTTWLDALGYKAIRSMTRREMESFLGGSMPREQADEIASLLADLDAARYGAADLTPEQARERASRLVRDCTEASS